MPTYVVPALEERHGGVFVVPAIPATFVVPAEGEPMGRSAVSTTVFQKDPSDELQYVIDWRGPHPGPFLEDVETLTDATVTVDAGLIKDVESFDPAGTVAVMLSGGSAGEIYRVTCTVETSAGRTAERSFKVWVLDL